MAHRLSIRLAVPDERQTLDELRQRASWANEEDREALLALPVAPTVRAEDITDERVFVADRHKKILGFAIVEPSENGDCEMTALFVDPDAWRGGIGKLLVTRCCLYTKSQGGTHLQVVGNPHADGFYEACGFESLGTLETPLGTGLKLRLEIQHLLS